MAHFILSQEKKTQTKTKKSVPPGGKAVDRASDGAALSLAGSGPWLDRSNLSLVGPESAHSGTIPFAVPVFKPSFAAPRWPYD